MRIKIWKKFNTIRTNLESQCTKILGEFTKNTAYWCNLKLAQRKGLQFHQTRSHAIACDLYWESGIHENRKDSHCKVHQSPRLPGVVITPNSQYGLRKLFKKAMPRLQYLLGHRTSSQRPKEFEKNNHDVSSIPGYVIRKNSSRGAKHGPSERQRMYCKSEEMLQKGQSRKARKPFIHICTTEQRLQIQKFVVTHWMDRAGKMLFDRIALENHSYFATKSWENSKIDEPFSQLTKKTAKRTSVRGNWIIWLCSRPSNRMEVLRVAGRLADSFVIVVKVGPNPLEDDNGILSIIRSLTICETFFLRIRTSFGWQEKNFQTTDGGEWAEHPLKQDVQMRTVCHNTYWTDWPHFITRTRVAQAAMLRITHLCVPKQLSSTCHVSFCAAPDSDHKHKFSLTHLIYISDVLSLTPKSFGAQSIFTLRRSTAEWRINTNLISHKRSKFPCRYKNCEKTRHVDFGILPCAKTTSLRPFAYMEENVSSDMRLMRCPAKSQRKVVRKDQLLYWGSLHNWVVYLKILIREEKGQLGSKNAVKFSKSTLSG